MSNTEHKRCQRLILVSPFPNSAWAFLELACSLDKFSMELRGWERAEPVRWAVQGAHFPGSTFCCGCPAEVTAKVWRAPLPWADAQLCQGGAGMVSPVCCNPTQTGINSLWKTLSRTVCSKKQLSRQVQWINSKQRLGLASCLHNTLCTSHCAALGTQDLRQDGKLWIIHIPWDQAWNPILSLL